MVQPSTNAASIATDGATEHRVWKRPKNVTPGVYDTVEICLDDRGVLIRSSLTQPIDVSDAAFADFVAAAKAGEFDEFLPHRRPA